MSESPAEPDPTTEPAEPEAPGAPEKQPDLPDPAFPEVLPGGEDSPGAPTED